MTKEVKILGAITIIAVIAVIIGANYYQKSVKTEQKTKRSSSKPTVAANDPRLVGQNSPSLGAPNAPVTMVEFFDPECEACRAFNPTIKKILKDYEGKVRLVVRYMPLHGNSLLAAQVIEAAGEQGKFWQMQDLLLQRQPEWGEKPNEPQTALFEKYAAEIGLNVEQLRAAIADSRYLPKIERDKADGQSIGVRATPTIFVNGRQLLAIDEQLLKSMIDEELKK